MKLANCCDRAAKLQAFKSSVRPFVIRKARSTSSSSHTAKAGKSPLVCRDYVAVLWSSRWVLQGCRRTRPRLCLRIWALYDGSESVNKACVHSDGGLEECYHDLRQRQRRSLRSNKQALSTLWSTVSRILAMHQRMELVVQSEMNGHEMLYIHGLAIASLVQYSRLSHGSRVENEISCLHQHY